jgi:hypothetical protein
MYREYHFETVVVVLGHHSVCIAFLVHVFGLFSLPSLKAVIANIAHSHCWS